MKGTRRSIVWNSSISETGSADFASDSVIWRSTSLPGRNGCIRPERAAVAEIVALSRTGVAIKQIVRRTGHNQRPLNLTKSCILDVLQLILIWPTFSWLSLSRF
jgi:hypothetical protein